MQAAKVMAPSGQLAGCGESRTQANTSPLTGAETSEGPITVVGLYLQAHVSERKERAALQNAHGTNAAVISAQHTMLAAAR